MNKCTTHAKGGGLGAWGIRQVMGGMTAGVVSPHDFGNAFVEGIPDIGVFPDVPWIPPSGIYPPDSLRDPYIDMRDGCVHNALPVLERFRKLHEVVIAKERLSEAEFSQLKKFGISKVVAHPD